MKLINKANRNYIAFGTILAVNEVVEVEGKTAEILLKQPGVEKYIDVKDVEALEAENELNKLKVQAMELGIKIVKKDTVESLTSKIEKALKKVEKANTGDKEVDSFLNGETDELPEGTEIITEEEANKLEKAE